MTPDPAQKNELTVGRRRYFNAALSLRSMGYQHVAEVGVQLRDRVDCLEARRGARGEADARVARDQDQAAVRRPRFEPALAQVREFLTPADKRTAEHRAHDHGGGRFRPT